MDACRIRLRHVGCLHGFSSEICPSPASFPHTPYSSVRSSPSCLRTCAVALPSSKRPPPCHAHPVTPPPVNASRKNRRSRPRRCHLSIDRAVSKCQTTILYRVNRIRQMRGEKASTKRNDHKCGDVRVVTMETVHSQPKCYASTSPLLSHKCRMRNTQQIHIYSIFEPQLFNWNWDLQRSNFRNFNCMENETFSSFTFFHFRPSPAVSVKIC